MKQKKKAPDAPPAPQQGIVIGKKVFLSAVLILFMLMLVALTLSLALPQGQFQRRMVDGRAEIIPGTYALQETGRIAWWRVFTAPFEVLAGEDAVMAVTIIAFILLIGGTFLVLDKSGVLRYIIAVVMRRFQHSKYKLMAAMVFVFMLFGSTIGMFEELVTLTPIAVVLAISLGWDSLVGMGISVLAAGFGFAAGTFNPFTVGIAQSVAQVPLFSGLWYRVVVFALIYALLLLYLTRYARRVEQDPRRSLVYENDRAKRAQYSGNPDFAILQNAHVRKGALALGVFMLAVALYVLLGTFIPGLSDVSLPVMGLLFTVGGLTAGALARYSDRMGRDFLVGMLSLAPSVLLILMAMSVKQIIVTGGIMDTILNAAAQGLVRVGPLGSILLIYLLVLVLEFFINSGSAKAFLVMPLLASLSGFVDLTRQSIVLAYVFGDGFTNLLYPTNPVLLIALGLAGVGYGKWFKFTWKLQLGVLLLTALLLLGAVALGYGPI
nr:YfcC family protein [Maliibacterium massiliense]